jgi:adenylate cyclase
VGLLVFVVRSVSRNYSAQKKSNEIITNEKKKSEDLLLNILPSEVADELKEKGNAEARYFDNVTVLFTDFVGFTKVSERLTPKELVAELNACFSAFDGIMGKYNIEKIKAVGDAYLAVSGLPAATPEHALHVVLAATDIKQFMAERKTQLGERTFDIRIGVHSGNVVAGIVGVKKFAYDIWGDTVNTAARMEQNSESGKINISQTTYELVKDNFTCTYRGEIEAKNKGRLSMYFVA